MSDDMTTRLGMPLLQAGQAQKEAAHNEALTLLDLAVQASVVAVGPNVPPAGPATGACWIVGPAPGGAWAGHAHALAGWTAGGWRFVAARAGMTAWSVADGGPVRFDGAAWTVGTTTGPRQAAITDPAGGGTADAEARATIAAILRALRTHGLIAV